MKVVDVVLNSLTPISLKVLLEDATAVEVVEAAGGEALIQIEHAKVERYTVLHDKPEFDVSEFWRQMYTFTPRLLMIPNENAFTGFTAAKWQVLGVVSTVANFEGNAVLARVNIVHEYAAKSFMPSLRKDIKLTYLLVDQAEPSHLYHFADMMDKIAELGEQYSSQFLVAKGTDAMTITVKYKGIRDNRHLELNKVFDEMLGKRHVEEGQ